MAKAIALLSGGLDSQIAVKLMLLQGIEVECLTSVSVFHPRAKEGRKHPAVAAAERFGVPITLINTNDAMLAMVRNPVRGRGRNMNPCLDCRIFLLRTAAERMRAAGAGFIVTGEVLGQRPMSQLRWPLSLIEREAGVQGLLLRPLSAKLLPPTQAELAGLVDRERLYGISGRSRKEQMALAASLGISEYPTPAGGCLLTEPNFSHRLRELMEHGEPSIPDIELLRFGRHFRLDSATKAIVGRDETDNIAIEEQGRAGDLLLEAAGFPGPTTLLRGNASAANIETAARITARYGKGCGQQSVRVVVRKVGTGESSEMVVAPASAEDVAAQIIARQ